MNWSFIILLFSAVIIFTLLKAFQRSGKSFPSWFKNLRLLVLIGALAIIGIQLLKKFNLVFLAVMLCGIIVAWYIWKGEQDDESSD